MIEEPGWYPDPYFMGRERYWDGGEWTEQCRSAETKEPQPSVKPRPARNPAEATPSATAAKAAAKSAAAGGATATTPATRAAGAAPEPPAATAEVPVAREEPSSSADEPSAPTEAVPAPKPEEPPAPTREEPPAPPPPAAEVPDATKEVPAVTEEDAPPPAEPVHAELADSDQGDRDVPEADEHDNREPPPRRRRRFLVGAVAAVVVIIVAIVVALVSKGSGGGTSGTVVAQAASATVQQQYATVSIDVNVPSGAKAAAVVSGFSGNGTFDLASSLGAMTLTGPGNAGTELMVLDNQTMYLDPAGLVSELVPNKLWVSATPDDLGSTSSPSGFAVAPTRFQQLVGSPTALLRQLEASGVTATALRSSIYQGTPVEEYNVTLSQQAINIRLQSLPSSLRGAISIPHAPEQVFLTTNGLVRAISVPVTVENNGTHATGHVVIGYSAWGNVADISAPPADQVVSWAQFKAVLSYTSKLG